MRNSTLCTVVAALAITAVSTTPAFAKGGTGGGGGGGGGGTTTTTTVLPAPAIAPGTFDGIGSGPVYVHDSFGHAQTTRLKQDGSIIDVGRHAEVSGIRAEYGNNKTETWSGVVTADPRWQFASIGPSDPFEQYTPLQDLGDSSLGYNDGDLALVHEPGAPDTRPDALIPFPAPTTSASTVSGETVGFYGKTAIGFTTSGATTQNFESNGQVWLEVDFTALFLNGDGIQRWTFHTGGQSTTLSGTFPIASSAYNRLAVSYDPVNHVAAASINGTVVASVPYTAQTIKYAGIEGTENGNLDNFSIWAGTVTDPMPAAIAAPDTPATTRF